MGVITGLTAERMLEIEAASVVDGDVVGDDLFLTKRDGTLINAGNVRGGPGPVGPQAQGLAVVTAQPILDVGIINQIRAGRPLTPADFTNQGLSIPLGLYGLSNFSDSSGNGRNLTSKGAVPVGVGINGLANTAAVFAGLTTQGLFASDSGAADPFRIRTGSWGGWIRTARRGVQQDAISKLPNPYVQANSWFQLGVMNGNTAYASVYSTTFATTALGITDVADDRWHFVIATYDGTRARLYVDGMMETIVAPAGGGPLGGSGAAPFSIGGSGVDAAIATSSPFFGRVDEAFITADVLSEDQVRYLYAASIPHALGVMPSSVAFFIRRRRRGAALAVTDFPAQPVRLHNFVSGAVTDQGSGNVPLVPSPGTGAIIDVAGPDGAQGGAKSLSGAHAGLASTDAGLPAGVASRTYSLWFKTLNSAAQGVFAWGTPGSAHASIGISGGTGAINTASGADVVGGPFVADGYWHQVVVVEDNAPTDTMKRKLYLDGRFVGGSAVLTSLVLAGAGRFRVGAASDGTFPFVGQVSRAFIYAGALTSEQVRALYAVGSQQSAPNPKELGEHIEAKESNRLLVVLDKLETVDAIDLAVMA